jgi:hypothetical protein
MCTPVKNRLPTAACLGALVGLVLAMSAPRAEALSGQTLEQARDHWAFQPIHQPAPPKAQAKRRADSPIDAFLMSKLEAKGLSFAPPAPPRVLLRRVYYDVTGLPPTFEEIQGFERDHSARAWAKVVDRLLASPRYGERWGRHWLDVARYADTKDLVLAYGKDALRPYAYTYRDYVIRAFNEDLPFDQFVQDQLAADLEGPDLPRWRLAALGFLTLGRLFDNNPHDQIDDQIDTTTRGFLALTVACARCHDHKYDAITQRDYYGLYGVFASTERPYDLPLLEDPNQVPGGPEFEQKLAAAQQELDKLIDGEFDRLTESFRLRIGDYLVRAATTKPDISETAQFGLSLTPDDFRPSLMLRTRRLIEERANPNDRVFGPWAELMVLPEDSFSSPAKAKLTELSSAGAGQTPGTNRFNPLVLEALNQAALTNQAGVARAYGQLLKDVYEESKKPVAGSPNGGLDANQLELLALVTSLDSPIWFPKRDTPKHLSRPEADKYGSLVSNLDKLAANATNPPPARAMVVRDLPEPIQPHVFRRGNPSRPGDLVPRAFVRVLSRGEPKPFSQGSGRLELARAITAPDNPLTARVFVNRVWMHHFGEPLVGTTTDFGARSEKPVQAELLDWLAAEFIRSGWSVKHLHRVILMSKAYQQSVSGPSPADPENTLLGCFQRRRLDLEAMRDSLLFASGRLDPTVGGPPTDVASDPMNYRRTVYGLVDRQNLPALFRAFDFAGPDQCAERRPRTSVPQQALFGLNSPFVMEQARALVARPEIAAQTAPAKRVDALFRGVLGRMPTRAESAFAMQFVSEAENEPRPDNGLSPWEEFAQVLLVSNEAVFVE